MALEASMKERNYRTVDALRKQNNREQRRLEEKLYSKQGLEANRNSEIYAVSREQQRIKQELSRIKQTITTTWGILPPRGSEPAAKTQQLHVQLGDLLNVKQRNKPRQEKPSKRPERNPYRDMDEPQNETRNSSASSDTSLKNNNLVDDITETEATPRPSRTNIPEVTLSKVNVDGAKENVARRLAADKTETKMTEPQTVVKKTTSHALKPLTSRESGSGNTAGFLTPIQEQNQEGAVTPEEPRVEASQPKKAPVVKAKQKGKTTSKIETSDGDQSKYNADGSLRMVYKMPDFDSRFSEAKKARYIRHKDGKRTDKELSLNEIFGKK